MRILLLTVLFLAPTASFASSFSDVPVMHPNADAIAYVKAEGIVEGYEDGTFKPSAKINRAEFTKIVIEAIASDSEIATCDVSTMSYFSDVSSSAWYAPYICVGRARGIVQGHLVSSGKPYFAPSESINLVEAAKIITVGFGIGEPPLNCDGPNGIICAEHAAQGDIWYKRHIVALADRSAIPRTIASFDQQITRGEMAEMIWRLKAGIAEKPSKTYEELLAGPVRAYHNAAQKLSFSYPASYRVETDGVHLDYEGYPDWYRIELSGRNGAEDGPWLTAEVNPDGYGPIFADESYTMVENDDGSIAIAGKESFDDEYSSNDDVRTLVANSFEAKNGNTYYWRFTYPDSGPNLDSVFLDILASARLGK